MPKNILPIRTQRHRRIRAKLAGTAAVPRLAVYRSLKHISVQLIDDGAARTLAAATDRELTDKKNHKPVEVARKVGSLIAGKAKTLGIESVVFDRGGLAYHGRIQAVAEGAREAGLKF